MSSVKALKVLRIIVQSLLIAFVVFSIVVIVSRVMGYDYKIMLVHRESSIGIKSDISEYRLVQTSDGSGQYLMYAVIQLGSPDTGYPKTVFVADDFWYHSRYITDYGWIEGTNDFYIDSSDSGRFYYRYGNGTWEVKG